MELFTEIRTAQYLRCRSRLDERYLPDLDSTIQSLLENPFPPLTKPLKGSLRGKHTVRFANQTHRLIVSVNLNSRSVSLLYLAHRAVVYQGTMW